MLVKPPEQITVLDVINAVDPVKRIRTCPLGLENHGEELCPLHRKLDDAASMIEQAFADTTIAQIIGEQSELKPLCELSR
jgi:DNA-binding IscR family transcriptional regulator